MMLYGLSIWEESICTYARFIKTTFSRWFPVRRPHSHGVRVRAATLVHRVQDECSGTADPPPCPFKESSSRFSEEGGGGKGWAGSDGRGGVEASHR